MPQDKDFVSREAHQEFEKRIEASFTREDARLSIIENDLKKLSDMNIALTKLTTCVESMVDELKEQGKRLSNLEDAPKQTWNHIKGALITGICTAIGTAIVSVVICHLAM